MNLKILAGIAFFLLILGNVNAVYTLCDSIERDSNLGFFRCTITSTQYEFTQQTIDGFWENMKLDGDYKAGRVKEVEWKIANTVLAVADELHFVQPEGMSLDWDLVLVGDTNTTHDLNQSISTGPRTTNHTAIREKLTTTPKYFISITPLGTRKSIRNITLEKPEGAFAVYISGNKIKKMEMDITGNLDISGGFVEDLEFLKAKNITMSNNAYIRNVGFIEAENISLEGNSYIRDIGSFGERAIGLDGNTGLSIKDGSSVDNIKGGVEVDAAISLEEGSWLENLQYAQSDIIQWIHAGSITLTGNSRIRGIGGSPGEIIINGLLSLDESNITGREANLPSRIIAGSISLSNQSKIEDFKEIIKVTGDVNFSLSSGSTIKDFSGTIDSCAPLSLDGNTTKIYFTESSEKIIKAKSLALDNNSEIVCLGTSACDYNFFAQNCAGIGPGETRPNAILNILGKSSGKAPLTVNFVGLCQGINVSCTIDYGEALGLELFDGNSFHIYEEAGTYVVTLKADNNTSQFSETKRVIIVTDQNIVNESDVVQGILSKQSVEIGSQIEIEINSETQFKSFIVGNDFGLPEIKQVPESFPAKFGPFTIPDNAPPGIHSFTVSGITMADKPFSQSFSFTVLENTTTGFDFSGLLLYGIIGTVIALVAIILVVVVVVKKKGPFAKKKLQAASGKEEGKISESEKGMQTPKTKEQPMPETTPVPKPETKEQITQKAEPAPNISTTPPWMIEEKEEDFEEEEFEEEEKAEEIKPEEKTVEEVKLAETPEEPKPAEQKTMEEIKPEEKTVEEQAEDLEETIEAPEEILPEEPSIQQRREFEPKNALRKLERVEEESGPVPTPKVEERQVEGIPLDFLEKIRKEDKTMRSMPAETANANKPTGFMEELEKPMEIQEEVTKPAEESIAVKPAEATAKPTEPLAKPAEPAAKPSKESIIAKLIAEGRTSQTQEQDIWQKPEKIEQDVEPQKKSRFSFLKKKKENKAESKKESGELPSWLKKKD